MRQGQRDAEFELYAAAARPRLRWRANSLCGDTHAADDIAQTALAKLYVVWPLVRKAADPDAYVLRHWLCCPSPRQRATSASPRGASRATPRGR